MNDVKVVILSTTMLLEPGVFRMMEISVEYARKLAKQAHNFVGHSTVKVLGIPPAETRETCNSYEAAIVIKVASRLEFGKEYSLDEIEKIGYSVFLIQKATKFVAHAGDVRKSFPSPSEAQEYLDGLNSSKGSWVEGEFPLSWK